MTKELLNSSNYISQSILKQCFQFGKHNFVDKVVCGNGFSTAFLRLPINSGKHNIIICPNKAVIESKRRAYIAEDIDTSNSITFHYQESSDSINEPGDIMMFVIDTFLKQLDEISDRVNTGLIDKILIDESHTVEQSSSYRSKLRDFQSKLNPLIKNCSIVSVSATPNHFSKVDIRINNSHLKPIIINCTANRLNTINRIKLALKKGKKVYVATNDWSVIYSLRHSTTRKIEANFILGEGLLRSLVDKAIIIHNPNSNLVIGSSASFEGMDLMGIGWHVYYFEDRSRDHETFFISNLYQVFSRPREGAVYMEYCRSECNTLRAKGITKEDVDKFLNNNAISTEKKMGNDHKKFHPYVIFTPNNNGFYSIKEDEVAINLLDEGRLFDAGFANFQNFLNVRKITINSLNEAPARLAYPKIRERTKVNNLLVNKDIIENRDLFGNKYRVNFNGCQKSIDYFKAVQKYLRNKNYDGQYRLLPRQLIGLELLKDPIKINKLAKKAISNYNEKHKNDLNGRGQRARAKKKFTDTIHDKIRKLIVLFVNTRISEYYTIVGNRQYSNIVGCPSSLIQDVCDIMGITFTQVDISIAFSRVLYALNGLKLPENFYGIGKKNKLRINILLNSFFHDDDNKSEKKCQKYEAKRKFKRLGFNSIVINWLIDNYFECDYRGDLFNFLAWHEKNIIDQVKDKIHMEQNNGCIRKHDELMLFNNKQDLSFLNNFEYLGVGGWFNIEPLEEEETKESLYKFFKEMAEFEVAVAKKRGLNLI